MKYIFLSFSQYFGRVKIVCVGSYVQAGVEGEEIKRGQVPPSPPKNPPCSGRIFSKHTLKQSSSDHQGASTLQRQIFFKKIGFTLGRQRDFFFFFPSL